LVESLQKSRLAFSNISQKFPLSEDAQNKDILYHRYYISELYGEEDDKDKNLKIYDAAYRVFKCHIWDNSVGNGNSSLSTSSQAFSNVFVKSIPCYDVSTYLDFHCERFSSKAVNETELEANLIFPDKNALEVKMNNKLNSSYTESIACQLVSRLTEEGLSPHFPRIFGIFSATTAFHPINFTDEFTTYNGSDEFEEGIKQGLWSVILDEGSSDDNDSFENSDDSFDDFSLEDDEEGEEDEEDGEDREEYGEEREEYGEDGEDGEEDEEDGEDEEEDEEENEEGEELINSRLVKLDSESDYDNDSFSSHLSFKSMNLEDLQCDSNFYSVILEGHEMSIADIVMKEIEDFQTEEVLEISRKKHSYGSGTSYFSHENGIEKYIVIKDMPCQVVVMEGFPLVLEDVLSNDFKQLISTYVKMKKSKAEKSIRHYFYIWLLTTRRRIFDRKWIAIMLQVIMALITMNYYYDMIHNDLHTQNILFEPTSQPFVYYKVNSVTYRVPTFGYIIKIIDYGRATYRLYDNELIMGDVFKAKGEAGEQFAYANENFIKNPKAIPNRSFDLCRLGCSVLEEVIGCHRLTFITEMKFYKLIQSWTKDDQGKSILRFTGFDLYKQIVRRVHHLEPLTQLNTEVFQEFICKEESDYPMYQL
jgi:hypothetical protein